jgi:valine--pyruvate aminotransferase
VVDDHVGAICVSRPTNPTGNVVSDTEIEKLMYSLKNMEFLLLLIMHTEPLSPI